MAGIKISGLPATAAPILTDLLPEVQAGITEKVTLAQIATLFGFANGVLQPSAGGTGFAYAPPLNFISVPMTAAQWNAMYATPFLLIPPTGSTSMIFINNAIAVMTYGTTDYASGGVVGLQYGNTAHGGGTLATNTEAAADFFASASTSFIFDGITGPLTFANSANLGIYLSNATGAFTTGDSTWDINIYYTIISLI